MKSLFIFIFILFLPLLTSSQNFGVGTTEDEFFNYFDKHAATLDSLEGLWIKTSNSIKKNYIDGKLASTNEENSEQNIAIIKGKDGFTEFNMVKGICTFILNKNTFFSNTAEKNKYILNIKYDPDNKGETSSFTLIGSDFHIKYSWKSSNYKDFKKTLDFEGNQVNDNNKYSLVETSTNENWHKLYPN